MFCIKLFLILSIELIYRTMLPDFSEFYFLRNHFLMWPLANFEFFDILEHFWKIIKVIDLLTFDLTKLLPTQSDCCLHILKNCRERFEIRRFQRKFVTDGEPIKIKVISGHLGSKLIYESYLGIRTTHT